MLPKLFETKKLHYGKYLYKLVLVNQLNTIFRKELQKDNVLGYAKSNLDKLADSYNNGEPLLEKRYRTNVEIDLDNYFDAIDIYNSLLKINDYKIRVSPWRSLAIYSNDKDSLIKLSKKLRSGVREFWEPDPKFVSLLLNEENIIVVNEKPSLEYRVTLGRNRVGKTQDLATWLENNSDKSRVGPLALSELKRNGWVDGFYFYVRDQKVLMLVQMMIGNKIRRIDKLVYKDDIDKY